MKEEAFDVQKALDAGYAFGNFNQNGIALKLRLIDMRIPLLNMYDDDKIGIKIALMQYIKQKNARKRIELNHSRRFQSQNLRIYLKI